MALYRVRTIADLFAVPEAVRDAWARDLVFWARQHRTDPRPTEFWWSIDENGRTYFMPMGERR